MVETDDQRQRQHRPWTVAIAFCAVSVAEDGPLERATSCCKARADAAVYGRLLLRSLGDRGGRRYLLRSAAVCRFQSASTRSLLLHAEAAATPARERARLLSASGSELTATYAEPGQLDAKQRVVALAPDPGREEVVCSAVGDGRPGRRRAGDVDVEPAERELAGGGGKTLRGIQPPVVGWIVEVGGVEVPVLTDGAAVQLVQNVHRVGVVGEPADHRHVEGLVPPLNPGEVAVSEVLDLDVHADRPQVHL